jgi:two-component system sensor histidine kinase/response regulator
MEDFQSKRINILVIEDDPDDEKRIRDALQLNLYTSNKLIAVDSLERAVEAVCGVDIDVILLDLSLPDCNGLDVITEIRKIIRNAPIVVLTEYGDIDSALRALQLGAQDYLVKGQYAYDMLTRSIQYARERHNLLRDLEEVRFKLSERVEERTRQLELANKELESFNYSVSHDLRSPLRVISYMSGELKAEFSDKMDASALELVDRIVAASDKMSHLIEDLLQLSRLTQRVMKSEKVDISRISVDFISELSTSDINREVSTAVEPNIIASGDSNLLRIAMENLLRNAWKFTRKTPKPSISIGKLNCSNTPVYYVKDNGVGFDMKYADKLFAPFQRLHSDSDFPGTGIGLATVQRIIYRHDGQIWAQSAPGQGTTFYFTIQAAKPADFAG